MQVMVVITNQIAELSPGGKSWLIPFTLLGYLPYARARLGFDALIRVSIEF